MECRSWMLGLRGGIWEELVIRYLFYCGCRQVDMKASFPFQETASDVLVFRLRSCTSQGSVLQAKEIRSRH